MRGNRERRAGALALAMTIVATFGAAPGPALGQAPASHPVAIGLALPGDLAWGADGTLYVTDHLTASVSAVGVGTSAAPGTVTPVVTGGLRSPGAIAFDQGGNLWVTDNATRGDGTLLRVPADPAGHLHPELAAPVTAFTDASGRSLRPDALAVDSQGFLYVGMTRGGEIARVTTIGPPSVQRDFAHTSTDSGAIGLAVDGRGRLLVSERSDVTAVDLSPGPSPKPTLPFLSGPLGPIELVAPTDLVVTPDALFVLDTLRVVQVPLVAGLPQPAGAGVRMNVPGSSGGLVADQIDRPRRLLGDLPRPALLAGSDRGSGAAATGTVLVSDLPLTLPGLAVPPPLSPAAVAVAPLGSAPGPILAIQVLPRETRAPAFPRLHRSERRFHPGAGRVFSVTFRLRRSARITFTVRNRRWRPVRRFRAGPRGRGTVLRFNWDGRDLHARVVRPGLYRFRVTASARGYHRTTRGSVRVVRRGR